MVWLLGIALVALVMLVSCARAETATGSDPSSTVLRLPRTWRFQRDRDQRGLEAGFHRAEYNDVAWDPIDTRRYWNHGRSPDDQVHAWYRVKFTPPASFADRPLTLFIQTLGGDADIYVNGEIVGTHHENDLKFDPPMELDVAEHIAAGETNVVAIHVRKQRYEVLNDLCGLSGDVLLYPADAADDVFPCPTPDYTPAFTYEDGRIFDRDWVIALLNTKKLWLDRFSLAPGKAIDGGNWCLIPYWPEDSVIEGFEADQSDPAELRIAVSVLSPRKTFRIRVQIRIYYDSDLCSYAYENQLTLDVLRAKSFNAEYLADVEMDRFPAEYLNLLPSRHCDMSGPTPRFTLPWDSMIYRDAAGRLVRLPATHLFCSGVEGIRFAETDAFFAYMGPDHSQVIELFDETPRRTVAHICWAAYDVHVKYVPVILQRQYAAHYRIVRYAPDRCRALLAEATTYRPSAADIERNNRPIIAMGEVCGFDKGFDFETADESSFWLEFGDIAATRWSRDGGVDGSRGLVTRSDEPILAGWRVIGSAVAQHLQVTPGTRYEITARIRTDDLRGKGAWVQYAFQEDWFVRKQESIALAGLSGDNNAVTSDPLTGTNDWTTVTLTTPPTPAEATNIELVLYHDGAGASMVDSFHIQPVE